MIDHAIDIKKYNEANFVLKNFIQRSARLLPIFAELKISGLQDLQSERNFNSIANLFQDFNYDDTMSQYLINSDILERIRVSYQAIYQAELLSEESSEQLLSHFFEEYNRLIKHWMQIELN
jgi:hypothetical protein